MGCDYYTWVETVILYRNALGTTRRYVDKPEFEQYERNYCIGTAGYDPDFEERPDELEQARYAYGTKNLFHEGEWLCNETGKARIVDICAKKGIAVDSIIRVYKHLNGRWR